MERGFKRRIFRCNGCKWLFSSASLILTILEGGKRHRELFESPYDDEKSLEAIESIMDDLETYF
jgi:hypothetical protein